MLNVRRFEQVRKVKGVTKAWLADKLGMSAPVFSRRLNGPLSFTKEQVMAMSVWLMADPRELWLEGGRQSGGRRTK